MSTQIEREAAARALAAAYVVGAGWDAAENALDRVIDAPDGWRLPDGTDSETHARVRAGGWIAFDEAAGLWLAHVRALDAANAAPVAPDPLAGVVWRDAGKMVAWAESPTYTNPIDFGIDSADDQALLELHTAPSDRQLAAHARAQLAREAKAAPVAVTLEEARRMCREAGDTVVTASGYARPDVSLAWMLVRRALGDDGIGEIRRAIRGRTPGNAFVDAEIDAEIARLRALGVTPAVLK